MKSKLLGIGIVGFWVVMMAALVRVEYSEQLSRWDEVPLSLVVQKVFGNPDPIRLNVYSQDKLLGYCRLDIVPLSGPGTNLTTAAAGRPAAYHVQSELAVTLAIGNMPTRVRVTADGRFTRRFVAERFRLRGAIGEIHFDLHGGDTNQPLAVSYDLGDGNGRRQLKFDDPSSAGLATALGLPATALPGVAAAANTKAYFGRFTLGAAVQRGYLVETRVNDAIWVKVWVDEAGQVLRVDTSAGLTLRSEVLEEAASVRPRAAGGKS